jgi:hypothetical protein
VIDKEKRFQILEQTGGVIILAENFPEILDGDLYNYWEWFLRMSADYHHYLHRFEVKQIKIDFFLR